MPATDQPAAPGQHPFPVRREDRESKAKLHVLMILLFAVGMAHCAGQLRELLDQAEEDCVMVEGFRKQDRADRKHTAHGRR